MGRINYPGIKQRAKQEGAEIYWGDETGIHSDCQHERGYAPKGKTPIVKLNAKRCSLNMISAITNQGTVRFQIYEGSMNADRLIDFLKQLIKTAGRKVFLILDNLRVYHARVVKAWLKEHDDEIEIFYLPSYSPELNPDEYLNCDLKGGVYSGIPARPKKKLKSKVLSYIRMLKKKPTRAASYFRYESIKSAA
ncbi:IS630 family transposase [Microbulbifer sp. GL-2]|uniref:IS630 family transposase n=1 Tax=Microbulbifer sp. GL-2 TaxID=2591606 RepID=UPI001161DCE1|nr:IS630 family transposase [Microbulbifer sp. GL-2]BBM02234.1 putative transposase [Microbulbifer sp. GL-2]